MVSALSVLDHKKMTELGDIDLEEACHPRRVPLLVGVCAVSPRVNQDVSPAYFNSVLQQ